MLVTLNNVDVSPYIVGNSFTLTTSKAEVGQVLLNPIPSLVGLDVDGFWNPRNPVSVFYGINDYSVFEVEVFEEGVSLFNGFISDIARNQDGTVAINLETEMQRILSQNLIYTSGDGINPTEMFVEICELYNIKYDPVSTLRSSSIYNLDSVVVKADVLTPDTPILSFFEALSQVGVASIYSVGGYLYYQVFEDSPITNTVVDLENRSDTDSLYILTKPVIGSIEKDIPSGYTVTYRDLTISQQDESYTYRDKDNSFSISGGGDDLITISTVQSAIWVGAQWLKYLERADTLIMMDISTELARDLLIGYSVGLNMYDGTDSINFIIKELTTHNSIKTSIVGVSHD